MALNPIQVGQANFLTRGGAYELPLQQLREKGLIDTDYVFREYPKMITLSRGFEDVQRTTEDCRGRTLTWVEKDREILEHIKVNTPEEEERVLSGGQTSTQLEDERQGLLQRCRNLHIMVDPTWSAVRLRKELGEFMEAPPLSADSEMDALKEKLALLEEKAAMRAKIEALEAQLAAPQAAADEMRAELTELGIKVDGRWSVARLREELEKATAA